MKVAGCRAALYPLRTEHITLGIAYSDTAAVTSCSRRSQHVKSIQFSSSSYIAPTALGIKQEIEHLS